MLSLEWYPCRRLKDNSCASACNTVTTLTQPHRNTNRVRTRNKTTDVPIQQQSRKFPMMDIFITETRWVHKKWNKIENYINLVLYSTSTWMRLVFKYDHTDCSLKYFFLLCCLKPVLKYYYPTIRYIYKVFLALYTINTAIISSLLHRAFRRITLIINQQMHYRNIFFSVVTPCMLSSHSIILLTTALTWIYKIYTLKH